MRESTPRTEAGRALFASMKGSLFGGTGGREAILAIEREAAAATPSLDRDKLFDEIDQRFGRNVARFVDARLDEGSATPDPDA